MRPVSCHRGFQPPVLFHHPGPDLIQQRLQLQRERFDLPWPAQDRLDLACSPRLRLGQLVTASPERRCCRSP